MGPGKDGMALTCYLEFEPDSVTYRVPEVPNHGLVVWLVRHAATASGGWLACTLRRSFASRRAWCSGCRGEGYAEHGSGWPDAGPGSARAVCRDSRAGCVVTEAALAEGGLKLSPSLARRAGFFVLEVKGDSKSSSASTASRGVSAIGPDLELFLRATGQQERVVERVVPPVKTRIG